MESFNPARPSEVVGTFPESSAKDVDAAVQKAAAAQPAWAAKPYPSRAAVIAAAEQVLIKRKDELAQLITREVGKTGIEASGEAQEAIDMAAFVAGMRRGPLGETYPSELPNKMGWTTRQPVGVVGMITPWNFPMAIPSWKCFPALLAGNGIVIKPSEFAPACGEMFVRCLLEGGVPQDLIQVVHGFVEPAAAMIAHPVVRAVSFTGSVPTGRKVAEAAMANGPKLVSLELGGKNAMVVFEDADTDLVVDGALFGAFGTSGQRCTSTSRLIAQGPRDALVESIAKRAADLRLGDPSASSTDVGPVIDERSLTRINEMVQRAVDEGAEIVTGGKIVLVDDCPGGTFFAPTILTGVRPDHHIARHEVFGPVLAVIEVAEEQEAYDVVNDVDYGLSAAVYTRDINRAMRAVDAINTGIVYVNAPTIGAEIGIPFGGVKHTGNGFREAAARSIEQFSELKSVWIDYSGRLQRAQIDT